MDPVEVFAGEAFDVSFGEILDESGVKAALEIMEGIINDFTGEDEQWTIDRVICYNVTDSNALCDATSDINEDLSFSSTAITEGVSNFIVTLDGGNGIILELEVPVIAMSPFP